MTIHLVYKHAGVSLEVEGHYDPGLPGNILEQVEFDAATVAGSNVDLTPVLSEEVGDGIRKRLAEAAAKGET